MDQKDAVKMRGESTENGGSKIIKFYSFPSTKILVSFLRETGLFGQFWSEKLAKTGSQNLSLVNFGQKNWPFGQF